MRYLVLGNAKSGTTALFYALANSIPHLKLYFEEPFNVLKDMPKDSLAKIIFELSDKEDLDKCSELFAKKIAIIRDPRDNIVSRMLYSGTNKNIYTNDSYANRIINLVKKARLSFFS